MKAKAMGAALATKPMPLLRLTDAAQVRGAVDNPRQRLRRFLVHALRLRAHKTDR